eukprot:12498615-Alexandrium_andersonii.AAC.1
MLVACRLGAARVVASTPTAGLPPGPPRMPASCLWRSSVHLAGLLAIVTVSCPTLTAAAGCLAPL